MKLMSPCTTKRWIVFLAVSGLLTSVVVLVRAELFKTSCVALKENVVVSRSGGVDGGRLDDESYLVADPTCFDEQKCDSGLFAMSSGMNSIGCNFTLMATHVVQDNNPPDCTNTTFDESRNLGQLITIPIDEISDGEHQYLTTIDIDLYTNTSEASHGNITLPFGVGSTCDGMIALYMKGEDYIDGYEVIATKSINDFSSGILITGTGFLTWRGWGIHRKLHEGCMIGMEATFTLEATCLAETINEGLGFEENLASESSSSPKMKSLGLLMVILGMVALPFIV